MLGDMLGDGPLTSFILHNTNVKICVLQSMRLPRWLKPARNDIPVVGRYLESFSE